MVGLREFVEINGVIRTTQFFFMEEDDARETNEYCLLMQYKLHWLPEERRTFISSNVGFWQQFYRMKYSWKWNNNVRRIHIIFMMFKERQLKWQDWDVCFIMQLKKGREVQLHNRVHFADEIRQPILSFGRILEIVWGIDGQEKTLCFESQIKIPLEI